MTSFVGQACTSLQSTLTDHLFRLVEGWAESWSAKVKTVDRDLQLHTENWGTSTGVTGFAT